jgi:hypothetical protein
MHEKYAKAGLVCVSLSTDRKDNKGEALKFLQKQKATFPNYWLDEETEVWQKAFAVDNPPAQIIYDRTGKVVHRVEGGGEDAAVEVETVLKKLLPAGG